MGKKTFGRSGALRQRLAGEAARIMAEQGIGDFGLAKRKAAERLGVTDRGHLPRNSEIESALIEHQRLFGGDRFNASLTRLRQAARSAMLRLAEFEPRLAGPVLTGAASPTTAVDLHLFADSPETVAIRLLELRIRHDTGDRRLRRGDDYALYPVFRFLVDEVAIEATVFPPVGLRQAPRSPVDGRPMKRATLRDVDSLLEGNVAAAPES